MKRDAPAPTSVATPLADRTVCSECGHLHRRRLADRCDCCATDAKENTP